MNDIRKYLEQDAQVITERIPMAKTKAREAAGSLKAFMADHDYSQAKIAKMLGVSTTQINHYLNGKYKGDTVGLANKVVHLINSITRKDKRVRNKPFIDTTVARTIGTLITQTERFTDDEGKIGMIIGDGGHGKSHCMRAYAAANKNTIYVELDDAMTPTLMFAEIAKTLGLDSFGSLAAVTRRLIDNLVNRHIIVMLDEASGLKVKQLNQLRQIIVVKSRCPLILAGNSALLNTVTQSSAERGRESLDQFYTRLMQILNLDKLAADKKDGGLYTPDDIRKLYEFGGVRLAADAVDYLQRIARTPKSGRLRTCSHIVAALHVSSRVQADRRITAKRIIGLIKSLDLPIRVKLPVCGDVADETETHNAAAKAG